MIFSQQTTILKAKQTTPIRDQNSPQKSFLEQSAIFMTAKPNWTRPIRSLGWLLFICPPLGWLMALGYRKQIVLHLFHPNQYPITNDQFSLNDYIRLTKDGLCALGVMSLFFLPSLMLSWTLGFDSTNANTTGVFSFIQYALASLSFPPITLGGVNMYYQGYLNTFYLSPTEGSLVIGSMVLATFILPLAYMQIGFRGKWRDALNLRQVLMTLLRDPVGYILAWKDSIRLTIAALFLGLYTPWGIIWSYQGIVWRFNRLHLKHYPEYSFDHFYPKDIPNLISKLGVSVPIWWR